MKLTPLLHSAPLVPRPGVLRTTSGWEFSLSTWRVLAWLVIGAMGAIQAWGDRYVMNPDGIAYLDLAHAFLRGDWGLALNRYWSPLYPALVAVILRLWRPGAFDEFPAAHVVNFLVFLAALASFEFLMSQLLGYRRAWGAKVSTTGRTTLPEWFLRVLGYTLFTYASLWLITLSGMGSDLLVSVFVYLALGLVAKMRQRPAGAGSPLLLGVVLGLGYLAKSPMFPLAVVFLALAGATIYRYSAFRHVVRSLVAICIPFALITGALVLGFILTGQGVTLGESGRLNYAFHVNGLPYVHWQGEPPGNGKPVHPTRQLFSSPPVYEFTTPVSGTYPPWDDLAYWYEGVTLHFDAGGQFHNLVRSVRVVAGMLLRTQVGLVIGALVLWFLGRRGGAGLRDPLLSRLLTIPAIVAVGMFSLVWLERRFVAPFVVPFWLGVFGPMTFPSSLGIERAIKRINIAMLVVLLLGTTATAHETASYVRALQSGDSPMVVVQGLRHLGVRPDDKVAVIWGPRGQPTYYWDAYWALLSGVRIIAEIPQCPARAGSFCVPGQPDGVTAFLQLEPGTQNQILQIFQGVGATAVVMRDPYHTPLHMWRRIPNTDYSVYLLRDETTEIGSKASR